MTEKWFMLLLYCLPLLFKVWQKSGSYCGCYIVYHYCLSFTEESFILLLYCLPLLLMIWQRSGSCCCYIVYHYCLCLRFDRGVVHAVVVILSTITVLGLTEEWFMLLLLYCISLLFKVWQRIGSCYCCYIVHHYCLRLDRGMVYAAVVILSTIAVYGFTEECFTLLWLVMVSTIAV
jgi:hypothetical protein